MTAFLAATHSRPGGVVPGQWYSVEIDWARVGELEEQRILDSEPVGLGDLTVVRAESIFGLPFAMLVEPEVFLSSLDAAQVIVANWHGVTTTISYRDARDLLKPLATHDGTTCLVAPGGPEIAARVRCRQELALIAPRIPEKLMSIEGGYR